MSRTSLAAVSTLLVCLVAEAGAQLESPLLGGKSARLVDKPGTASDGAKVKFARDPALAFPPSPLCPTTSTLDLSSPGEQPGPVALPCTGWSAKGTGFVYSDKLGSAGGVRKVTLKAGKLSITAKGGAYRPITGPVASLDVRLDIGGQQYCGRFVTFPKNLAGNVRAKGPTVPCGAGPHGSGDLVIDGPADGAFMGAGVVRVSGRVFNVSPGSTATVRLRDAFGEAPTSLDLPTGRWVGDVVLGAGSIVNPVLAELTVDGQRRARQRITLIAGASLDEGQRVPHGIGVAVGASVFPDHLDALLTTVAGPLLNQLWQRVVATDPDPDADFRSMSHSGHFVQVRPGPDSIDVVLHVSRLTADLRVDIPLGPDCNARITISGLRLDLRFIQSPDNGNPSRIDFNMPALPSVQFAHIDAEGDDLCEFIEGRLRRDFANALQPLAAAEIGDPDLLGPDDSPISDALEDYLDGLDVGGRVGAAFGINLDARFAAIVETPAAVAYDVEAGVTASQPHADAPDLAASYHQPAVLPIFGSTTPSGQPYDLGILLSTSVLNQLAKASVESGILNLKATAIGSQPLTPAFLGQFLPVFGTLQRQDAALELRIRPTVAPIITAGGAPPAAPAVARLANLMIDVVDTVDGDPADGTTYLALALDARLEVRFGVATGELVPSVTAPALSDVAAVVLGGTLAVSDAEIGALAPTVVALALPGLVKALGPVTLPSIANLPRLHPVEVTSVGGYLAAFLDFNDPPWFVEPPTDLFVTIQPGGLYELPVVAQDGESAPVLTVDAFPLGSWSFVTDPPGSRMASGTFRFFGDVEGLGGATFTVTDEDGLVAHRFLTIQVCADPDVIICPLL